MLSQRALSLNESVLSLSPQHSSLSRLIKLMYNNTCIFCVHNKFCVICFHCLSQLQKSVPNAKIGFSKAMSAGWLRIDKQAQGGPRVFRKVVNIFVVSTFFQDYVPADHSFPLSLSVYMCMTVLPVHVGVHNHR